MKKSCAPPRIMPSFPNGPAVTTMCTHVTKPLSSVSSRIHGTRSSFFARRGVVVSTGMVILPIGDDVARDSPPRLP